MKTKNCANVYHTLLKQKLLFVCVQTVCVCEDDIGRSRKSDSNSSI